MPKATPEQTRKANKTASIVALCVGLFAACFIGVVLVLDNIATQIQEQEVSIAEQEQEPINPFYVLLIGSDTRKGTALYTGKPTEHAQVDQHSDVMTLVRVDPRKYTISLLTIPRDTIIDEGGEKINSALLEDDPEQVVEAVYELTGLRADYYMLTTFGMFADLIDAIGGVTVDVAYDVAVSDPMTGGELALKAGRAQKLDGAEALALARARAEYENDQDALRQANVRMLEQAIIQRFLDGDCIGLETLIVVLANDVRTDMDLSVLGLAVSDFMENADEVTIYAGTGPYEGGIREGDEQWVIQNDKETWTKIINAFKRGKDFTKIVEAPSFEEALAALDAQQESSASASSESSSSKSSASAKSAKKASKAKSKKKD